MDAINKALTEVYFCIPVEILNLGFNDNPIHSTISLDEIMLSRVIRPKVLVDCNLVGGIETNISIHSCLVFNYSTEWITEFIIDVPKSITGGKSIITPLGIFMGISNNRASPDSGDLLPSLLQQVNSASPPQAITTSKLELIGENKVLVADPYLNFMGGSIKCILENNKNLSNINPRSYVEFSKLVVLGVKAYIYNHLIVKMGKGYLENGMELGVITDIISDYSSANEEYQTHLKEVWTKVAFHNDKQRLGNFVAGLL